MLIYRKRHRNKRSILSKSWGYIDKVDEIYLFWGDWNENWHFPVLCPLLNFPNLLAYCSTFTASSFRIWNSSTGIPSPPLGLFIVMLSKTHLTSHSRMPGVITHLEWSHHCGYLGHEDLFLFSSVYSCHFLICSAFVRSIPFLLFIVSTFLHFFPLKDACSFEEKLWPT